MSTSVDARSWSHASTWLGREAHLTLSCQNKPKKPIEVSAWFGNEEKDICGWLQHFGPVYAVKRLRYRRCERRSAGEVHSRLRDVQNLYKYARRGWTSDCLVYRIDVVRGTGRGDRGDQDLRNGCVSGRWNVPDLRLDKLALQTPSVVVTFRDSQRGEHQRQTHPLTSN